MPDQQMNPIDVEPKPFDSWLADIKRNSKPGERLIPGNQNVDKINGGIVKTPAGEGIEAGDDSVGPVVEEKPNFDLAQVEVFDSGKVNDDATEEILERAGIGTEKDKPEEKVIVEEKPEVTAETPEPPLPPTIESVNPSETSAEQKVAEENPDKTQEAVVAAEEAVESAAVPEAVVEDGVKQDEVDNPADPESLHKKVTDGPKGSEMTTDQAAKLEEDLGI